MKLEQHIQNLVTVLREGGLRFGVQYCIEAFKGEIPEWVKPEDFTSRYRITNSGLAHAEALAYSRRMDEHNFPEDVPFFSINDNYHKLRLQN